MSAVSAKAQDLRPIKVISYPALPPNVRPQLPESLVQMFLRELSEPPHGNPLQCDACSAPYQLPSLEGKPCTRLTGIRLTCPGTVVRRWTPVNARQELLRLMADGHVAIAWELGEPSVPVGLLVCEIHAAQTVMPAVGFPPLVLRDVYSHLGREEPYFVFSHLWLEQVSQAQGALTTRLLVQEAIKPKAHACGLVLARVLVSVSTRRNQDVRRVVLDPLLMGRQKVLARENASARELWGFQIRID